MDAVHEKLFIEQGLVTICNYFCYGVLCIGENNT